MLVTLLGAASGGLAGAAADVLSEIVLKRIHSTAKLRYKPSLMLIFTNVPITLYSCTA